MTDVSSQESDATEDVYVVEKIISKVIRGKKVFYKIKWEGYKEMTWEPAENIIDKKLIDQFNESRQSSSHHPPTASDFSSSTSSDSDNVDVVGQASPPAKIQEPPKAAAVLAAEPEPSSAKSTAACLKCKTFGSQRLLSCSGCGFAVHASCNLNEEFFTEGSHTKCRGCSLLPPVGESSSVQLVLHRRASPKCKTPEFLVKLDGVSYRHLVWVPEFWLERRCQQKMSNFVKNRPESLQSGPDDELFPAEYTQIDRILCYRSFAKGAGAYEMRAMIKWCGLPHTEATFESEAALVAYDEAEFRAALERYKRSLLLFKGWRSLKPDVSLFQPVTETPSFLKQKLLPHQLDGMNWLTFNWCKRQSVMLADEMGLGKTIQTIAFLATLVNRFSVFPFLVVVPSSVCQNWANEFSDWCPDLHFVVYSGSPQDRSVITEYELFNAYIPRGGSSFARPIKNHVVITSYAILMKDHLMLGKIFWEVIVVDEGQRLKGAGNQLGGTLEGVTAKHRVLLTGTPLQNNLRELFTVLRFIAPDQFGKEEEEKYEKTLSVDPAAVSRLHDRLHPFILRRTKMDVRDTLSIPQKVTILVPVRMSELQQQVYRLVLERNAKSLKEKLGEASKKVCLNNVLMELRKCLNHPLLCTTRSTDYDQIAAVAAADLLASSGKLLMAIGLIERLLLKKHRVLIFSGMVRMLQIIGQVLQQRSISFSTIVGGTRTEERQRLIDAFNSSASEVNVFLLSTRAGGLGINLQSADAIIMYDSDYNPQQDLQAHSRAHRFGQQKTVVIYTLITIGSVEEKIYQKAREKLLLDHVVVDPLSATSKIVASSESSNELFEVLSHGVGQLFSEQQTTDSESVAADLTPEAWEHLTDFDRLIVEYAEKQETSAGSGIRFSESRVWEQPKSDIAPELAETAVSKNEQEQTAFWNRVLHSVPLSGAQDLASDAEMGVGKRKNREASLEATKSALQNDSQDHVTDSDKDGSYHPEDSTSSSDGEEGIEGKISKFMEPPASSFHSEAKEATSLFPTYQIMDAVKLNVDIFDLIKNGRLYASPSTKSTLQALVRAIGLRCTPEPKCTLPACPIWLLIPAKLVDRNGYVGLKFNPVAHSFYFIFVALQELNEAIQSNLFASEAKFLIFVQKCHEYRLASTAARIQKRKVASKVLPATESSGGRIFSCSFPGCKFSSASLTAFGEHTSISHSSGTSLNPIISTSTAKRSLPDNGVLQESSDQLREKKPASDSFTRPIAPTISAATPTASTEKQSPEMSPLASNGPLNSPRSSDFAQSDTSMPATDVVNGACQKQVQTITKPAFTKVKPAVTGTESMPSLFSSEKQPKLAEQPVVKSADSVSEQSTQLQAAQQHAQTAKAPSAKELAAVVGKSAEPKASITHPKPPVSTESREKTPTVPKSSPRPPLESPISAKPIGERLKRLAQSKLKSTQSSMQSDLSGLLEQCNLLGAVDYLEERIVELRSLCSAFQSAVQLEISSRKPDSLALENEMLKSQIQVLQSRLSNNEVSSAIAAKINPPIAIQDRREPAKTPNTASSSSARDFLEGTPAALDWCCQWDGCSESKHNFGNRSALFHHLKKAHVLSLLKPTI